MHRPFENCYWVEEGCLLAGEYPRTKEEDSSRDKIRALLRAGVTAFVDLTERGELHPYSHMIAPATHHRFPIPDVSVPKSPEAMTCILDTIDRFLDEDRVVYVHCWGGVGRTGVVIGCWLARRLGGRRALFRLGELWRQCPKSASRESPETWEQRMYIEQWRAGQ